MADTERKLFGRRRIFTDERDINLFNVARVVENAYTTHLANYNDIEYLYKYYKGRQPIIDRVKEVRPEIMNTIVENRANSIVTFRVGYTVGKPVQYVSSSADDSVSDSVAKLNDMMRVVGKHTKDKELVEWMMICGVGYRMVLASRNPRVPFDIYTLDPRNTFVIYGNDFARTPLAGVYYTVSQNAVVTFSVYTKDMYYEFTNSYGDVSFKGNPLGMIPIIEYPLNMARLGAFEVVLPLLDSLNKLNSNRIDSVEQFVQSLLVAYNCNFDDDVTANSIREAGMIVLKSVGDARADVKVISETLNQTETQTLKMDINQAINEIVGIPSQGTGSSDSSNNGAVILKNGWQGAETRAEDFEAMFKLPEQQTLNIVSKFCATLSDLQFDPADVDIKFTRRAYEDLLSKSQTLVTLLGQDMVHPQKAYEASGLFTDSEEAYKMGMENHERVQKELATEQNSGGEEDEIVGGAGKNWVEGYYR